MTNTWIKVPRLSDEKNSPMVTFRSSNSTLQFNANMRQLANLDVNQSVEVELSDNFQKIRFSFYDEPQNDNKYRHKLSADGGGAGHKGGLICMIAALRKHKKIAAIFENPNVQKKFEAKIENRRANVWTINLSPAFEERWINDGSRLTVSPTARGIYRYVDKNEVVYIGQGVIKERLSSAERREWKFDHVEFSILDVCQTELLRHEKEALEQHFCEHSKLPHYNKVGGYKPSAA